MQGDEVSYEKAVRKVKLFRALYLGSFLLCMLLVLLGPHLTEVLGEKVYFSMLILSFLYHLDRYAKVRDVKCPRCGNEIFNVFRIFSASRKLMPFTRECDQCDFKF
jgi:hypothetical protein